MYKQIKNSTRFIYAFCPYKITEKYLEQKDKKVEPTAQFMYRILTEGMPVRDQDPHPIVMIQADVDKYGVDQIVCNIQRKFNHNFNIAVLKFPRENLRVEPIEEISIYHAMYKDLDFKAMPMMYRKRDGKDYKYFIDPQYIESVYTNLYNDYAKILNTNWTPVPDNIRGMFYSPLQKEYFKAHGEIDAVEEDERKLAYANLCDFDSKELDEILSGNIDKARKFGFNVNAYNLLKNAYKIFERKFKEPITKEKIDNELALDKIRLKNEKEKAPEEQTSKILNRGNLEEDDHGVGWFFR